MTSNLIKSSKFILFGALFLITSCTNTKGWIYKANDYSKNDYSQSINLKNKTVVILPFSDKRSNENSDAVMLYMLPLAPYGYQNLSSPETTARHINSGLWVNFNPKEDFAKAMAEELNASRVFKEAIFSSSIRDSEYYVSGEILSMQYKGKLFSYGLSVYGPILWVFGLPATHVANDLEIKLSLIDSKTKKEIFTKTYTADHYKKLGWAYSLPNDFYYPEMLRALYKNFTDDIQSNK